jgi:hypothetical protein
LEKSCQYHGRLRLKVNRSRRSFDTTTLDAIGQTPVRCAEL